MPSLRTICKILAGFSKFTCSFSSKRYTTKEATSSPSFASSGSSQVITIPKSAIRRTAIFFGSFGAILSFHGIVGISAGSAYIFCKESETPNLLIINDLELKNTLP